MSIWGYANSLYNSACSGFAHIVGIMEEGGFAHVMGLIEEGVLAEPIVQYPPEPSASDRIRADTDLFATIFSYLPYERFTEIVQAMGNGRLGEKLSVSISLHHGRCHLPLQTIFPTLSIIDQGVWEQCFGKEGLKRLNLDFSGAPQLTNEEIDEIGRLQNTLPIDCDAGGAYMIMPKNATRKTLIALAISFRALRQSLCLPFVVVKENDQPVEKTYGVYISKGVLQGTRENTWLKNRVVLEHYKCSMPNLIDAIALCLFTYISSSADSLLIRHLASTPPGTGTYCAELLNGSHLVVGGIGSVPPKLIVSFPGCFSYGVCATRKFEAIGP